MGIQSFGSGGANGIPLVFIQLLAGLVPGFGAAFFAGRAAMRAGSAWTVRVRPHAPQVKAQGLKFNLDQDLVRRCECRLPCQYP